MPKSFLFGCKKLLIGWGYRRRILHVDVDKQELRINYQQVITAKVVSSELSIEYHGDFTGWAEFQANSDVNELGAKHQTP